MKNNKTNNIKIRTRNNTVLLLLLNQVIYSADFILMLFKCLIPEAKTIPIIIKKNLYLTES
ncbi:hypothetical protein YA49_23085 [Enterobacter cloacae subsp. cloacae]|nr:hypothetical protein YA49_23085 [Enterobacter cloacae subsp. cloacae]